MQAAAAAEEEERIAAEAEAVGWAEALGPCVGARVMCRR